MDASATPPLAIDLVRWTFTADPESQDAIEAHLDDLGADVVAYDDGRCVVSWEEPGIDLEEVVEALWSLNGAPFDVTQEEFHRTSLNLLQQEEGEIPTPDADAA
ncbi:hypothetical protein TA3x_004764 [Tundrisphaera sp. TA3]|uniref:hypothetical protein n=1 Tax=Tundrisphaera sp. TA3 TaxID=3435775 RepID=UPI003EBD8183